uniref:Uncharacterized protein n=1 Tax=Arundo donax TaxID=35708 RepID=A0A0A9GPB5_ARUDO
MIVPISSIFHTITVTVLDEFLKFIPTKFLFLYKKWKRV